MKAYNLTPVLLCLALSTMAQAEVNFSLDAANYAQGDSLTATWSERTDGFATDWIGLYPDGVSPGDQASTDWQYVSGSRSANTALESGSVVFNTGGLAVGSWSAFFLAQDGYTVLGEVDFTVQAEGGDDPGRSVASFTLNKSDYRQNEPITASWSGLTEPNATDWVGIYPANMPGVPDGNPGSTIWSYLPEATEDGSLTFEAPGLGLGEWRAYLLLEDGYTSVASFDFRVVNPPIIAFGADRPFVGNTPTITLSWVLNPGITVNSLELSDGDGASIDVSSLDTYEIQPTASTTYTLTLNGVDRRSATVLKEAPSGPAFSMATDVFGSEDSVAMQWDASGINDDSWLGIYRVGETPGEDPAIEWVYAPAGSGTESFDLPTGDYFAAIFIDGDYQPDEGPIRFKVVGEPIQPLQVVTFGPDQGDFHLRWHAEPGTTYKVEKTHDLAGPWMDYRTGLRPGGVYGDVYLRADGADNSAFYRIAEDAQP